MPRNGQTSADRFPPLNRLLLACLLAFAAGSPAARAQAAEAVPDAGAVLKDIPPAPPLPATAPPPAMAAPALPPVTMSAGDLSNTVLVKGFRIEGATVFPAETLEAVLQPLVGKPATLPELIRGAHAITAFYSRNGVVGQAFLPEQTVDGGIVLVRVVESRFAGAVIERPEPVRLADTTVQRMVESAQPLGQVVRVERLERGLLLLNDLAGISANGTLLRGGEPGSTVERVTLRPTAPLSGVVELDNAGPRAVGEGRANVLLNWNNPEGRGGQLSLRALAMYNGDDLNRYLRLAYAIPVGYGGLKITPSVARLDYKLGKPFQALDSRGDSTSWGVDARYSLLRGRTANLYALARFERKSLYSEAAGATLGDKKLDTVAFGLRGDYLDPASKAYSAATLQLLSGNARYASARFGQDGGYGRFNLDLQHLRPLDERWSWLLALSWQHAFDNLDTAEEISLGGANAVRAYPASEAPGDEGAVLSNELRFRLNDTVALKLFHDYGWLRVNHRALPGQFGPNDLHLQGVGLGAALRLPADFSFSAHVAWRIGDNPLAAADGSDSDGRRRDPRLWVSLNRSF
ncbi:ShlB/FhaC/HecB family hemolysin secretion/activation protein [Chitinimonas koreensis]|uniref:ShlB/FhaC/HecB family hemolysin secretion/activation protein n=1 Tax=Chitinimonas koreensis TaxID=356302 RepID=UPI000401BB7F|nr:ShlB/FhaC/HecB family hemolysin secretion/activation protein [Chitinimonas koreensis]